MKNLKIVLLIIGILLSISLFLRGFFQTLLFLTGQEGGSLLLGIISMTVGVGIILKIKNYFDSQHDTKLRDEKIKHCQDQFNKLKEPSNISYLRERLCIKICNLNAYPHQVEINGDGAIIDNKFSYSIDQIMDAVLNEASNNIVDLFMTEQEDHITINNSFLSKYVITVLDKLLQDDTIIKDTPEKREDVHDRLKADPYERIDISMEKVCNHCGSRLPREAVFCMTCGKPVDNQNNAFDMLAENVNALLKLSGNGNTEAMYYLGIMYMKGVGVKNDNHEGVYWLTKAADAGYAEAQCELGEMYHYGIGVEEDIIKSTKWTMEASEQGIIPATRGEDDLVKQVFNIMQGKEQGNLDY